MEMMLSNNGRSSKATILLLLLSGMGFTSISAQADELPQVKVSVTDKQCQPMTMNLPAGKTQFIIKNDSMRALEWEILDGVMVVAERENIAPGFYQKMTVNLEPGEYQTTCGLLTNPRGTLSVSNPSDKRYQIKQEDMVTVAAEYKFYLIRLTQKLSQWVAQDKPVISDEIADDYYRAHSLMGAFSDIDKADLLADGQITRLNTQIEQWKKVARSQTLTAIEVSTQLQQVTEPSLHSSKPSSSNQFSVNQWQGEQGSIQQWIDILSPLLTKVDASLLNQVQQDMKQWQQGNLDLARNKVNHDLVLISQYLMGDK